MASLTTTNSPPSLCSLKSDENKIDLQQSRDATGIATSAHTRKRPNAATEQGSRKKTNTSFGLLTKEMITECHKECDHVASWSADGKMILIKDKDLFANEIIPQYFDHNKFDSFVRQLNNYGFRKVQHQKYVTYRRDFFHSESTAEDLQKIKIKRVQKDKGEQDKDNMQKEINALKDRVVALEKIIQQMLDRKPLNFAVLDTIDTDKLPHNSPVC